MTGYMIGEHGPELVPVPPGSTVTRAFTESLHARGTGAQGGQFVAKPAGQAAAKKTAPAKKGGGNLSFDGKRGAGYGVKGGDKRVKALQEALNRLGLTDGNGKKLAVDGKLGPRTTAAIKKAQRKLGLKADGVVTPALLAQLTKTKGAKDLKPDAKKKAPAKVAAPKKKAAPARPAYVRKPKPAARPTVHRSIDYSGRMTDMERHGTHNQKTHGNRLGKPTNVAGKTGLGKATAALEDKPDQAPESPESGAARERRERAQRITAEIREELTAKTPKFFATLLGADGGQGRLTVKVQRDAVQAMRDGGWKFVDQVIGTYVVEGPDGTQVRLFQQRNGTLGFSEVGTGAKLTPQSVIKMVKGK